MAARRAAAPPILALHAAGCRIAMGTDNMAHDMLEAMRTGLFVERISHFHTLVLDGVFTDGEGNTLSEVQPLDEDGRRRGGLQGRSSRAYHRPTS